MTAARPTLHLICNAHIDPMWAWPWEEGMVETLATFRAAVGLLRRFPGFVFVRNESLLYEWIEEHDPALFAAVAALVRAGRWVIVGGWYVQPDCNMPGGESFVRQALYGKRYFMQKFGVEPTVGYNVDPFGHGGGLPQILRRAGYRAYVHCRPSPQEKPLPGHAYIWRGVDGSEVMAYRPTDGYKHELGRGPAKIEAELAQMQAEGMDLMAFWGVGDHGGGASALELAQIEALAAAHPEVEIRHSDPETYFTGLEAAIAAGDIRLPHVEGDLQKSFTGCYTSGSYVKRAHRRAEGLIALAERLSTIAQARAGLPYPAAELEAAWKDLLFNEFHDTLCGTSSAATLGDALAILGRAEQSARRLAWRGTMALARLDPAPAGAAADGRPGADGAGVPPIPIYVFNPHAAPYRGPVEAEFMIDYRPDFSGPARLEIVAADGRVLPSQEETPTFTLPVDWRKHLVWWDEIPPLSCVRYLARRAAGAVAPPPPTVHVTEDEGGMVVDAGRMVAAFDRATGLLTSLRDVAAGRELLAGPGCALLVIADKGDSWGMGIDAYREVVGQFAPADPETAARLTASDPAAPVPTLRLACNGPARAVVESLLAWGHSTAVARFTFYPGRPYLEVSLRVGWNEPRHMLKLSLPTRLAAARARCEIPYGAIERVADGSEHVGRRWVLLGEDGYGIGLINSGQYGFDVLRGELRLSLLRSPAFCQMDWGQQGLAPGPAHHFMDLGEHDIRLALVGGPEPAAGGDGALAATIAAAEQLNVPLMALPCFPTGPGVQAHVSPEPEAGAPFLTVSPETVRLAALKWAEDGQGYVVRLHEAAGQPADAVVTVAGRHAPLTRRLGPFELWTFRVSASGEVLEADLLERPIR